jgi:NAD(P)-dependent dehydrogenase (short-subunit alcohol dehydrogenase family)
MVPGIADFLSPAWHSNAAQQGTFACYYRIVGIAVNVRWESSYARSFRQSSAKLFVMAERLKDKIGIVTGAGSGIGRACAIALAKEGARVALVGRRKDHIEKVAREIGNRAFAISADVSQAAEISRLIDQTVNRFGGLNTLVNNAGVLHAGTVEQITEEQWDHTFNLNVRSVWLLSRAALPHMRKAAGGSIINLASVLGIVGARNRAAYAPSKGAMVQLTKCMAIDHGHENIRVNAICPSFVETELTAHLVGQAPDAAAFRCERTAAHPIGRLGRPEDVAGLAVYLASDESSWVTGAVLPVDGGYVAL